MFPKYYKSFAKKWEKFIYEDRVGKWIWRLMLLFLAFMILSLLGYLIIDNIIEN